MTAIFIIGGFFAMCVIAWLIEVGFAGKDNDEGDW